MNEEVALRLGQAALWTVVQMAGPIVIAGMIVGVLVHVLQAATQIQEQSLVFVPKVATLMLILLVAGGWMLLRAVEFAQLALTSLPDFAH